MPALFETRKSAPPVFGSPAPANSLAAMPPVIVRAERPRTAAPRATPGGYRGDARPTSAMHGGNSPLAPSVSTPGTVLRRSAFKLDASSSADALAAFEPYLAATRALASSHAPGPPQTLRRPASMSGLFSAGSTMAFAELVDQRPDGRSSSPNLAIRAEYEPMPVDTRVPADFHVHSYSPLYPALGAAKQDETDRHGVEFLGEVLVLRDRLYTDR
ncbi:hypothetical protein T492DRAFT_831573 [Pavlovales sp. CCMP2436]|nr:hypothetical protein T492DRAFT_831573 [Pavlovales sp. CCMP2436]